MGVVFHTMLYRNKLHYHYYYYYYKQERIIVVSCASRTCVTRRVFMRYTAMRYGFEMQEKANHR